MAYHRQSALKTLLESRNGFHITTYLENDGLLSLRTQLRVSIGTSKDYLAPVLSEKEIARLLEPLESLSRDFSTLRRIQGNVAVFRTPQMFRILSVPIDVEFTSVVASTFHVKPLLRWMQMDREFFIIGLEHGSAFLYQGSQQSFRLIDTIVLPDALASLIAKIRSDSDARLFVAGEREFSAVVMKSLERERLPATLLDTRFSINFASKACAMARSILRTEAASKMANALAEFRHAEELKLAKKNIFQIAKAAVKGKVRKLIIADGVNIFGKINPMTGGLAIHPVDLDHEDDCLLDDLAQMVLANGGEVIVATRDQIPNGHPILAILERSAAEAAPDANSNQFIDHTPERRCL